MRVEAPLRVQVLPGPMHHCAHIVAALIDEAPRANYHSIRLETVTFMSGPIALYRTLGCRGCDPYNDSGSLSYDHGVYGFRALIHAMMNPRGVAVRFEHISARRGVGFQEAEALQEI